MDPSPAARLGLLGGECTGKSTLAARLSERLDGCLVAEYLREFVDRTGRPPTREEQAGILRTQQAREDAAASTCPSGIVVADPATLMTAVYSSAYFDDASLVERAVAAATAYDLLVWCDVDLPWQPDGAQRDGPEYRQREHEILVGLVEDRIRPAGIAVVKVSGSPDERLEAALRAWQPGGQRAPT